MKTQDLLSVEQARELLGLSRQRIYQMIAEKKLTTVKVGKHILVLTSSVEKFLEKKKSPRVNARLISAAPELLEALQDCLLFIEGEEWGDLQVTTDKIRKAIAKALGQS